MVKKSHSIFLCFWFVWVKKWNIKTTVPIARLTLMVHSHAYVVGASSLRSTAAEWSGFSRAVRCCPLAAVRSTSLQPPPKERERKKKKSGLDSFLFTVLGFGHSECCHEHTPGHKPRSPCARKTWHTDPLWTRHKLPRDMEAGGQGWVGSGGTV